MRRPDLVADFESWLYDDDDDYERRQWFVSRRRIAYDHVAIRSVGRPVRKYR